MWHRKVNGREKIGSAEVIEIDADLGAFWKGGDLKVQAPSHQEVPLALKHLGPPPGGIEDALRGAYARIAEAAAQLESENSS